METVYFISEKELRSKTLINENVDAAYLNNAIITAQEVDLQQIIGTSLFNSLIAQIKAGQMKGPEYEKLMDQYISPYLINDVMAAITLPLHYKLRNSGVVTNNDTHYQSATLNEVTYVEQHYINLATFHANRMKEYIIKNKEVFDEIDCTCEDGLKFDTKKQTKSPIYFRK